MNGHPTDQMLMWALAAGAFLAVAVLWSLGAAVLISMALFMIAN